MSGMSSGLDGFWAASSTSAVSAVSEVTGVRGAIFGSDVKRDGSGCGGLTGDFTTLGEGGGCGESEASGDSEFGGCEVMPLGTAGPWGEGELLGVTEAESDLASVAGLTGILGSLQLSKRQPEFAALCLRKLW